MHNRLGFRAMRRALCIAAGAWLAGLASGVASAAAPPPVVPGYDRLRDEAHAPPAELGQVLLGELNCTACHAAPNAQRVLAKGAPDLSNAGARLTPQFLRAYLSNPHGIKAGTTMPDLFHASDPGAKNGAIDFLIQYLVSLGGPIKPATEEGDVALAEQGKRLYHTVGCVACHAPEGNANTKVPSYPLPANLAEKTTVNELEAFLLDPLKARPSSRMPSSGLSRDEAHAVAVYLLREQLDNPQAAQAAPPQSPGVNAEYYEQDVNSCALETIGQFKPKLKGHIHTFGINVSGRRNENFAMKFTAHLKVPRTGKYTFFTTSDDGSRLYIDAKLAVDNDGTHAAAERSADVDLAEGDHPIIVTYFQGGGESSLRVEWSGPGFQRQEIPQSALYVVAGRPMVPVHNESFTVDPGRAQTGGRMFVMIGCAACHNINNERSPRSFKPLASLNLDNDAGCLGHHPTRDVPQYDLNDEQRAALRAALADQAALAKPFEPAEQVVHTMAAMNCFACHKRGEVGGPTADRADYFKMTAEFDMGEEGRIPPLLSHVGAKLKPEAMQQIIFEGKLHVRPVMATRMPMFSKQVIGGVVDAFQRADSADHAPPPPPFIETAAKDGRQLVGVKGLGCVNCHGMNGTKSLGMPAPDLGTVSERIKWGWFHQWLDNPPSLVPGTRMPQFWPQHEAPLKNIAGGTEEGQIAATWAYLSLGRSMALPIGLIPTNGYELIPGDVPLVHRTFMKDVGPRAVLVGYPEMVHVAFDANGVKLVEAWRGKFFDARGMWESRGGDWLGPLGTDLLLMPPGPAFAVLDHADAPWPTIEEGRRDEKYRNVGGHFKGYALDKDERPVFHYVLNDTIDIHEQPVPQLKPGNAELIRRFQVSSKDPVNGLYFIAAAGKKIEPKSPGTWTIDDGRLTVSLSPADRLKPVVRDSNGQRQLLVPVTLENGAASFDEEISW